MQNDFLSSNIRTTNERCNLMSGLRKSSFQSDIKIVTDKYEYVHEKNMKHYYLLTSLLENTVYGNVLNRRSKVTSMSENLGNLNISYSLN